MIKKKPKKGIKKTVKRKSAVKKKREGGRPCLLDNKKLRDTLIEFVRNGNWYSVSCAACDISYSAFNVWMQEGHKLSNDYAGNEDKIPKNKLKYVKFMKAIKKAEAEVESFAVTRVLADADWKAQMTYLERKFPDRWGRVDRQKIDGEIKINVAKLTDEELVEIIKEK